MRNDSPGLKGPASRNSKACGAIEVFVYENDEELFKH
jgi:hypothetical protein